MNLSELINEDTYIIADTHFRDYRMTQYEPSRIEFANSDKIEDIDQALINAWNSTVKDTDIVLHLGDYAFKNIEQITKQLKGRKILLRGNHDKQSSDTYIQRGFEYIIEAPHFVLNGKSYKDYNCTDKLLGALAIQIANKKILFSHFPLFGTDYKDNKYSRLKAELEHIYQDFNCEINIHGHVHSKSLEKSNIINACVETIGFKPTKISTFLKGQQK